MGNPNNNEFDNYDFDNIEAMDYQDFDGEGEDIVIGNSYSNEFDSSLFDIDFSQLTGKSFKKSFSTANRKIKSPKRKTLIPSKPLSKKFGVGSSTIVSKSKKQMGKIIVPSDRKVIVEGVSKFILSNKPEDNALRNIGYYNGKKLQELVFTFNNDSALDFDLSLFNPSMPLDYLQSTSQNLNSKIKVAGGGVSYTDVLFNILGNPIIVRSVKMVISGPQATSQQSLALRVEDKYVNGVSEIKPVNLSLQIDVMQVEGNTITFDLASILNRPFIPDGMDVINYTILAGNTVTMCFYHEQKSLKKLFYKEAKVKRKYTG